MEGDDEDEDEDQPLTAEETMMKLKELKEKKMKNSNNSKATTAAPDVDSDDGDELLSSEYSDAVDDEGDDKEATNCIILVRRMQFIFL